MQHYIYNREGEFDRIRLIGGVIVRGLGRPGGTVFDELLYQLFRSE